MDHQAGPDQVCLLPQTIEAIMPWMRCFRVEPDAISCLKTALANDKSRHAEPSASGSSQFEETSGGIGLSQRIVPLIEMLELSLEMQAAVY